MLEKGLATSAREEKKLLAVLEELEPVVTGLWEDYNAKSQQVLSPPPPFFSLHHLTPPPLSRHLISYPPPTLSWHLIRFSSLQEMLEEFVVLYSAQFTVSRYLTLVDPNCTV